MRYLPLSPKDRKEMLDVLGLSSQDDLYDELPAEVFPKAGYDLLDGQSELAVEKYLSEISAKSKSASSMPFFLGGGCYKHHIPAAVDHLIQRAEYLTSYTPYQPEISQGTLVTLFEFQSMVCALTGMDVANASLYDGATAVVEAVLMAIRVKKSGDVFLASKLNPDYQRVLETYLSDRDSNIVDNVDNSEKLAAIIVQTPDFFGKPEDLEIFRALADKHNALLIVVITEIVSLGMLPAPKQADIVVAEGQSLGVSMNFGGPHLGIFACKKEYLRQIPGRICGYTKDKNGKGGYVLTLNAREQHIRRQKATSNICSNQGLNVVAFTIHLAMLGKLGLKRLARLNHHKAGLLFKALKSVSGVEIKNEYFFNEFVYSTKMNAKELIDGLYKAGIYAGIAVGENEVLVTATEMNSDSDIESYVTLLKEILNK